jgi:transposase
MESQRKSFTAAEKVGILRMHLVEKVPVSDLCDKHGITPNMFYRWQKEFFERGAAAFERPGSNAPRGLESKVAKLQAKLAQKDGVIAEIMQAHVELKKTLGEA